jgi:very-short-patch-repair endonuclease
MIKCKICNNEFKDYKSLSRHINSHNIDKEEYYINYINSNSYLCEKCGYKLKFNGLSENPYSKYCFKCVRTTDGYKKKLKQIFINKYGVDNPSKLVSVKNKRKLTCLTKYDVDNISKCDFIKEKKKQTVIKNYGVDNPLKHKDIREEIKNNNIKKYGVENVFNNELIKDKIKNTNLLKYNVVNPMQNEDIKNKYKNTILNKYNCFPIMKNKIIKNKVIINNKIKFYKNLFNKRLNSIEPMFNINEYNGVKNNIYKFKCKICNNEFYDHLDNGRIPRCLVCFPYYISMLELDIRNYIIDIYDGEILFNNRTIISPKELDIVIPDKKIAIEVNGDYWHSLKKEFYHENKSHQCELVGYKLIHIWESEWNNSKSAICENLKDYLK